MTISAATGSPEPALADGKRELGPLSVAAIFWLAFVVAVTAMAIVNPQVFSRQDPDSLLRLVTVRDLLAGQGWFDLVQHRFDPPAGILMHWSRFVDAPLAGLVLLGDLFGAGEFFALLIWPLLLMLAFMWSATLIGAAASGRAAVLPTALLCLLFIEPTISFLPGSIDHHNAQLALLAAAVACIAGMGARPGLGGLTGFFCALMLAIGLEMLPYVAVLGAWIALRWAVLGEERRGAAWFGGAIAASPAALHLLAGSPAAPLACDALSWAYAGPAAFAGLGLVALTEIGLTRPAIRLMALAALATVAAALFAAIAPACLAGPYGALSPELKTLWLEGISEAQPLAVFAAKQPAVAFALLTPPVIALGLALAWCAPGSGRSRLGTLLAALLTTALALSFYQVRTLPYANALAIPVLGAWLAGLGLRRDAADPHGRRPILPVLIAFVAVLPITQFLLGWAAVRAVSFATDGRLAPADPPPLGADARSSAERDCRDGASARLLASVPNGLVLAPVLYGPTVLALSGHSAVAGPYHRAGAAILDSIYALSDPPAAAAPILTARAVDYVAICLASRETAAIARDSPRGLLAGLVAGRAIAGLEPVAPGDGTALRLWRVR